LIPSLAGWYDNPILRTGPLQATQAGGIDSLESIPGILKRLQIRAKEESDLAGGILYVMDGPYRLPFPYRTAVALLRDGISSCFSIVIAASQSFSFR
jgi:hypothetical protein